MDPDLFRPLFNTFLYLLVCPKDILFVRYFKMYQDALVWFFTFLSWDFVAYRWRALYLCNIENVWELFTENHWETTKRFLKVPGKAPTSTISWDPCFFRTAIIFIGFLIGFSSTVLVFLVVDFSTVDIYGTHLMRNLNLEFLIKIWRFWLNCVISDLIM